MNQYIVMEQRVSDGRVLKCCGIKKSFDGALGRLFRCMLNEYNFKNRIVQEDFGSTTDIVDSYMVDDSVRFFIIPFDEC